MSNRVTITFEFDGLSDGNDHDLIEDALIDLESIVENLSDYTAEALELEVNGVGGPDRPASCSGQATVRLEVIR
jgi:hypothetical protein